MNKRKMASLLRFIGIVCWCIALFMLMDGKNNEKKEAEQDAVVMQMEENNEKTDVESTVIFPTED